MFTGIIEDRGRVLSVEDRGTDAERLRRVTIAAERITDDLVHGASVACAGACLTVVTHDAASFSVDIVAETLDRTTLGALEVGDTLNLERAAPLHRRLDGHIVQGHVDGTVSVLDRRPGHVVRLGVPPALARHIVLKGSVTLDGVSLTVADTGPGGDTLPEWFEVALVPTTLELTTLGDLAVGDRLNLEVDVLSKYVEALTRPYVGEER